MSVELLNLDKYDRFQKLMANSEWREQTIEQLQKDFNLAGVQAPQMINSWSLERLVDSISQTVDQLNTRSSAWENLNYRIDLPQRIDIQTMTSADISTLYLFRCFQKVWLRKHFSDASSKDAKENDQKHLKH